MSNSISTNMDHAMQSLLALEELLGLRSGSQTSSETNSTAGVNPTTFSPFTPPSVSSSSSLSSHTVSLQKTPRSTTTETNPRPSLSALEQLLAGANSQTFPRTNLPAVVNPTTFPLFIPPSVSSSSSLSSHTVSLQKTPKHKKRPRSSGIDAHKKAKITSSIPSINSREEAQEPIPTSDRILILEKNIKISASQYTQLAQQLELLKKEKNDLEKEMGQKSADWQVLHEQASSINIALGKAVTRSDPKKCLLMQEKCLDVQAKIKKIVKEVDELKRQRSDLVKKIKRLEKVIFDTQACHEHLIQDHQTLLYQKNLSNREFGKEAAQIFGLERATIMRAQSTSEGQKFAAKLEQPKTDSSNSFGISATGSYEYLQAGICKKPNPQSNSPILTPTPFQPLFSPLSRQVPSQTSSMEKTSVLTTPPRPVLRGRPTMSEARGALQILKPSPISFGSSVGSPPLSSLNPPASISPSQVPQTPSTAFVESLLNPEEFASDPTPKARSEERNLSAKPTQQKTNL